MKGITRYADVHVPMDEALTRVAHRRVGPAVPGVQGRVRARQGRRVRHRAGAGVVPGVRHERRHHAACRDVCTAPTITILPSPASRAWRGRCARRSRSIRAPQDEVPSTKGTLGRLTNLGSAGVPNPSRVTTMTIFTVHEPPPRKSEDAAPLRNASCSCATASTSGRSCWRRCGCCAHRLWLAFCCYVVGIIARCRSRSGALGVPASVQFVGRRLLIALLVGFEAATLRRWTLTRRRWTDARRRRRRRPRRRPSVASSIAWDATARSAGCAAMPPRSRRRRSAHAGAPPASDVIGLFPAAAAARRDERRHRRLRLGQSALGRQGLRARRARERPRSADPGDAAIRTTLRRADRIVLPGVGAFADCRRGLDAVPGMVEALEETRAQQAAGRSSASASACS